jgi:choloylglycine hydrolase
MCQKLNKKLGGAFMCTAVVWGKNNRYFGRNLDYDTGFGERVIITPRRFVLPYRYMSPIGNHYAIIGVGMLAKGYPLYFDGMNEHGLCMAGLNFVGNAALFSPREECKNVAQFELLPWILGECRSVREAEERLAECNLTNDSFCTDMPTAQLHWMIADSEKCCVLEIMKDGVHIYDNAVKVLTNNPPFCFHTENLNLYLNLTADEPCDRFSPSVDLSRTSRGMGAIGLPGDTSSTSRFIRAAFVSANAIQLDEKYDLEQFFHILASVEQVEGCVAVGEGYERTRYSSCCDTEKRVYHYRTYTDSRIASVYLREEELDGDELICYDFI